MTRRRAATIATTLAAIVLIVGVPQHGHRQKTRPRAANTAARCAFEGDGLWVAPDRACSPGEWIDKLPRGAARARLRVCGAGYNPRPGTNVSGPLKLAALREYGLTQEDGRSYEADHLYPRWLGGATTLRNFWPEPDYAHARGFEHNPKDRLEFVLYELTCASRTLAPATARRAFEGDWRTAYLRYVGSPLGGER